MTGPRRASLGEAKDLTNLEEIVSTHLTHIDQVIGLAVNIHGQDIVIAGKRWPGNARSFKDTPGTQPDAQTLEGYIGSLQGIGGLRSEKTELTEKEDLLDVQVQGETLLFLTHNIDNLHFDGDTITRKKGDPSSDCLNIDEKFQHNSVRIFRDKKTVVWLSDQPWNQSEDKRRWVYDITTKLTQLRGAGILELPIIIDPGSQNGGKDGWPQ